MIKLIFLSFVMNFTEPTQITIYSNTCDQCYITVSGHNFEICEDNGEWILEHDGQYYPTSYSVKDSICIETQKAWYTNLRKNK